jgi:hypothetical protein
MNVKVARLKTRSRKGKPASVGKTVARSASGRMMDIFTLDASSPTFDDDLTYVYRSNVANARRENQRLFGSADGLPSPARRTKPAGSVK